MRLSHFTSPVLKGLNFPSNGDAPGTVQFRFTGANLIDIAEFTVINRVRLRQHDSYYTTFFFSRTDTNFIGNNTYVGAHPYPDGGAGGSTHKWEISAIGGDWVTGDGGISTVVQYDEWKIQALRATPQGADTLLHFYFDLPDTAKRITKLITGGLVQADAGDLPGMTYGDAPWSPNNERLGGILRGIKHYNTALSEADILTKAAMTTDDAAAWYSNMNPTPDDISDKSGNGHNPSWLNANRPTLWTP